MSEDWREEVSVEGPTEAERVEEVEALEVEEGWGSGEDPAAVGESSGEGEEERREASPRESKSFVAMVGCSLERRRDVVGGVFGGVAMCVVCVVAVEREIAGKVEIRLSGP